MQIQGVILAGGTGRRMGDVDKALLPLAGRPLLAHVIDRFAPQVATLILSANGSPGRFAHFYVPVLPDDRPLGPLSGILAALRVASVQGATAVVSVPVDCPFLPGDLVPQLCRAAETAPEGLAMALTRDGLQPAFGLWPVALVGSLTMFLDSGAKPKVADFAMAHGVVPARFEDATAFCNLNTPEDLAQAEIWLGAQS